MGIAHSLPQTASMKKPLPNYLYTPHTLESQLVVIILIRRPSPHKLRLAPSHIDILIQDLRRSFRSRHSLRLRNLFIDRSTCLLVDGLELVLSCDVPLDEFLLQAGDGILGRAHTLDFFTRAVGGSGVGHRMSSVTIGYVFEDQGAVTGGCVGFAVGNGGFDGEDVHSVYFETRDILAALVVVGYG